MRSRGFAFDGVATGEIFRDRCEHVRVRWRRDVPVAQPPEKPPRCPRLNGVQDRKVETSGNRMAAAFSWAKRVSVPAFIRETSSPVFSLMSLI